MCDQMKNLKNNEATVNSFNKVASLINSQMKNVSM
jgi:hypothetical protein